MGDFVPHIFLMKKFTREELKRYNGTDNPEIYIAYEGYVYDVSKSFLWRGGKHQAMHYAGEDLTSALNSAPHGKEFILKFPRIGILIE